MAYLLNKSFILQQLTLFDVTEAQFDAASLTEKSQLVRAVCAASFAADAQALQATSMALSQQSIVTSQKQASLADAQLVWYNKANTALPA